MEKVTLPSLNEAELKEGLHQANLSKRRRHPKILHEQGAEFNEVINFMMEDSYMQPHLHPGPEKIEKIYLLKGKLMVLYFDDNGEITDRILLEKEGVDMVAVPAFKWHTYVMLSHYVVTYETMMGKYEPLTWKNFFSIAPEENTPKSGPYLGILKASSIV